MRRGELATLYKLVTYRQTPICSVRVMPVSMAACYIACGTAAAA